MNRQSWLKLGLFAFSFLLLEVVLRFMGFAEYPLYYKSQLYEYALQPNQSIQRLGVEFTINSNGMRSKEKSPNSKKILGFGDSVLNGGMAISQEDLASTIIDSLISIEHPAYQFLNISAGSWGVSNAYAWFQEHELTNVETIVLVFSSHDWNDNMDFKDVVGNVSFYPSSNPSLAITGFLEWIYSRYFETVDWESLPRTKEPSPNRKSFDKGWQNFIDYAEQNDIEILVYHHPNQDEMLNNRWEKRGLLLKDYCQEQPLLYISGLETGLESSDYRDQIHLSKSGQRKMSRVLLKYLQPELIDG